MHLFGLVTRYVSNGCKRIGGDLLSYRSTTGHTLTGTLLTHSPVQTHARALRRQLS
jgi:hypothetical protein